MSNFAGFSRPVVIRTSRDTLSLVAAASAMTFAMAYAVHSKHERTATAQETQMPASQQDWAGHLAELVPTTAAAPSEPMSSAALVVPKAQLALPIVVAKLPVKRPCLDPSCAAKPASAASPPTSAQKRTLVATVEQTSSKSEARKGLIRMLNPLNHLPDMSMVGRPFASAGNTVAGWFKRL